MSNCSGETNINDLLEARAAQAWDAMPSDVRFAMRKALFRINALSAIKEVGRYYSAGMWSITPFPQNEGFGALGLVGCKYIYDRLCEVDS